MTLLPFVLGKKDAKNIKAAPHKRPKVSRILFQLPGLSDEPSRNVSDGAAPGRRQRQTIPNNQTPE
jgi:hypothetical protein